MKITVDDVFNSKPIAWPIKFLDCRFQSDIFAVVVFASEEKAREMTDNPPGTRPLPIRTVKIPFDQSRKSK